MNDASFFPAFLALETGAFCRNMVAEEHCLQLPSPVRGKKMATILIAAVRDWQSRCAMPAKSRGFSGD